MTLNSKIKLLFQLLGALSEVNAISQEDVEVMKNRDALERFLSQINTSQPEVSRILIDERDQYLAFKLRTAPGSNIVAVVGAGHVPGIQNYLQWELPKLERELQHQLVTGVSSAGSHFEDAMDNI